MMMRSLLIGIVIVLLMCPFAHPQDGLALMKTEVGARPAGMGGAFVSIAGDPNSAAYNPAAVVGIDGFTGSFGYNSYWSNIRLESGYLAMPTGEKTYFHVGIRFASVDELERRQTASVEPEGLFKAYDMSLKSGLAYRFHDNFTAGFAIGWFFEKIDAWRGSAFNTDVGVLYNYNEDLTIGASINNHGSDFTLKRHTSSSGIISLPTTVRLGASYRYLKYLGAANLVVLDDKIHYHFGAEADLHPSLSVRAGYMMNYDSKDLTAGASFIHRNLSVEYAFVPYSNDLGTSHMFNLTFTL